MSKTAAGLSTVALVLLAGSVALADGHPADVCLETAAGVAAPDEWDTLSAAVAATVAERTALFPLPALKQEPSRLDIDSGHLPGPRGYAGCLELGHEWTARFGREFLDAGADQMLAEAPTTPGIASAVDIEWLPEETRLRTVLVFAGPLDIPNGTCWVDELLSIESGAVAIESEEGVRTSLFAEGACGRFFDHLPDGGAGEQALTLLPTEVELADGSELRFVAELVEVRDDALVVAGSVARD